MSDTPCGQPRGGTPVTSEMNFFEFKDFVRENSELTHPNGTDRVFQLGTVELMNPKVMCPDDYAKFLPYII